MLVVTLLWSIAAVVTRLLEAARGFEMTFWRSGFTLLVLAVVLGVQRARVGGVARRARSKGEEARQEPGGREVVLVDGEPVGRFVREIIFVDDGSTYGCDATVMMSGAWPPPAPSV